MRRLRKWVLHIIYMSWSIMAYATDDHPWSVRYSLPPTEYIQLSEPTELIGQALAGDELSQKAWAFSVAIELNLAPDAVGRWDTIANAGYAWRAAFTGATAHSLAVTFNNFDLPKGDTVYVYDASLTTLYHFTANDDRHTLPTAAIDGHSLIVEWNMLQRPTAHPFTIAEVGYGFRDTWPVRRTLSTTDPCDIDISCVPGNHWQLEKRAVVRLQTRTQNGVGLTCSGVLVNQTGKTKKNYLLTAGHCVSSPEMAERCVFTFNYEKTVCGSNIKTDESHNLSGASLLAYRKELDFALLEITQPIPKGYRPYFVGWSNVDEAPQASSCIHHPEGREKKICIEHEPLTTGTYNDGTLQCETNAHWQVRRWDVGVTSNGSSGSPLFNRSHQLVGTLTGGDARCSSPINDYFSKISRQWNRFADEKYSLKQWLDPDKTGATSVYGYDPNFNFEGRCDTMTHIGKNEGLTLVKSDKWGSLTGHNDKGWTAFAEKFHNDTVATIVGLMVNIAEVYPLGSRVRFSVWSGASYPIIEEWGADYIIQPEYKHYPFQIYFDKPLRLFDDYFVGFNITYDNVVDTFAVSQSVRRPYAGISSLYVRDAGYSWTALSEELPPSYASLAVKALGRFGSIEEIPKTQPIPEMKIVCQPGNDLLFAYMENPDGNVTLECFDIAGKQLYVNEVGRNFVMPDSHFYLQMEVSIAHLPAGMYVLRASDRSRKWTGKFVKIK